MSDFSPRIIASRAWRSSSIEVVTSCWSPGSNYDLVREKEPKALKGVLIVKYQWRQDLESGGLSMMKQMAFKEAFRSACNKIEVHIDNEVARCDVALMGKVASKPSTPEAK